MYSGLIIFDPIGLVCGQKAVLVSTTSLFHRHSVGLCNSGFLDYLCPFVYTFCSKKTICVQSERRMQMSSWRKKLFDDLASRDLAKTFEEEGERFKGWRV